MMTMTETTTTTWLDALKPGDTVVVSPPGRGSQPDMIVKVIRVTAAQIITEYPFRNFPEMRFRKSDGDAVERPTSAWDGRARLLEATPERVAAIREAAHRERMTRAIRATEWHKQTTAALEAVSAALGHAVIIPPTTTGREGRGDA